MLREALNYKKGSYRKSFIFILVISFFMFIYSSFNKDIPSTLITLSIFFGALKQVVIPVDLNQNITLSKRRYNISDDDFINNYNSSSVIDNENKDKISHKLIILFDDIFSLVFIAVILHTIFF